MKRLLALLLVIVSIISVIGNTTVSAETTKGMCEAAGEITTVKGDLNDISLWEKGGISAAGAEYSAQNCIRTKDFLAARIGLIYAENDYVFRAAIYDRNERFLGFWNNQEISPTSKSLYYLNAAGLEGYKIRLFCQRFDSNFINVTECYNMHFLSRTDKESAMPRPTLTFIDDDGSLEALNNWEDICDETGIKITAALVTNAMGNENDPDRTKASWSDVARLQEKGFEFVSHTHNHINITKTSEKTCEADLAASVAALREHGCEYRYLVYPYNATNAERISLVKKYFEAAVGLGGTNANPGSDNTLPVYTYWLRRYSINEAQITTKVDYNGQTVDAHAFKDIDTLKGYIDDAITNNSWVIIMTHLRNDGSFYHNEESRRMIVELCKYARERGVAIQTFGEAYSNYKNLVETGNQSVYANPHYIVDCNGVAHYRGQNEMGHIEEILPSKMPTCKEAGLTEGKRCVACDKVLIPQTEIPASNKHIYDDDNDAVCNSCYGIRKMVDTFAFADHRVIFEDKDVTHTNPRVVVYNTADRVVADPSDEAALNAIDANAKTHWGAQNINKIVLTDAGNYVLLLKYNVGKGAAIKVPLRVVVSSAPKLFVDNNKITVIDSCAANINHRLVAYYLGDKTVTDIYDEAALKTIDPAPVTYWGLDRINNIILQKAGNYALLLNYNEGKSAKKVVAMVARASALTEPVIEGLSADYKLVVTDEDAYHTHHRATVYYLGDQTIPGAYDEGLLKTADPTAVTHWGLDRINKAQLRRKGNYAVVLHYNLSNGTKRTVTATITVDLETPILSVQQGKLMAVDVKNQYINHRATVYRVQNDKVADIYDEAALKRSDPTAKTYWGLEQINKIALTESGCYVVMLHYNLSGSAKMTVAVKISI